LTRRDRQSARAHLDRPPGYLPESWTGDHQRRVQAGVPDDIEFATRSQLASGMITAAVGAQVPARWSAADEAHGNYSHLRRELRKLCLGYVLAVSRDHLLPLDAGKTRRRADLIADELPAWAWTRRSAGDGSRGPRFYDWAWLADVGADGDPDDDGRHSVLIRRNSATGELAFYRF
jgi:SRSO17 transposase